ncbi:MAG: hypothetical protein FJW30_13290 [Acidobacteria bacterium]|nr:hypothetical protein [Acidobacteriota bacterium]
MGLPLAAQQVDLGYRWNANLRGSLDTYRGIVNLGEGPRLLGFQYNAGTRLRATAGGWGGDPSAWFKADGEWANVHMRLDHRDTAYFNAMPSYANPLLDRGVFLNQRAFDTRRRFTDLFFEFGGRSWKPYAAWTRDGGDGRGVTTFVSDGNEYPVANTLDDATHNVRGGVEWNTKRGHLTLEQGGLFIQDDQRVFTGTRNEGNRASLFLGRRLVLNELLQTYNVTGRSLYSRAAAALRPAEWLDLSGNFLFSQPRTSIDYRQNNRGLFVDLDALVFADQQSLRWLAASKQPHTTANGHMEVRPNGKLTISESLYTDRFHSASSWDRLVWNQNQQQLDVVFRPQASLALRGGHRYSWADGRTRTALFPGGPGQSRRHTWMAGFNLRLKPKWNVFGDLESARSSQVLFRSSLGDFDRLRLRARCELLSNLSLQFNFGVLDNQNPPQFGAFELKQRQAAASIEWRHKRGNFSVDYARFSTRSNLDYTVPELLRRDRSVFRDDGHSVNAFFDLVLPKQAALTVGGSSYRSAGSRPSHFHQPQGRVSIPIHPRVYATAEYRWFGFSQPFFLFETFRSHQFMAGLRLLR